MKKSLNNYIFDTELDLEPTLNYILEVLETYGKPKKNVYKNNRTRYYHIPGLYECNKIHKHSMNNKECTFFFPYNYVSGNNNIKNNATDTLQGIKNFVAEFQSWPDEIQNIWFDEFIGHLGTFYDLYHSNNVENMFQATYNKTKPSFFKLHKTNMFAKEADFIIEITDDLLGLPRFIPIDIKMNIYNKSKNQRWILATTFVDGVKPVFNEKDNDIDIRCPFKYKNSQEKYNLLFNIQNIFLYESYFYDFIQKLIPNKYYTDLGIDYKNEKIQELCYNLIKNGEK